MSIPFSLGFDRLVVVYSSDCCSGSMPSCRCCMLRTGGSAEAVVSYPGRLQLDHSPGGVVHLRHRQAEPVPQVPEPFVAGPGDRLLQLPPVEEVSQAGGGASHSCHTRCGKAPWVFIICCRIILIHGVLLGGLAGTGVSCSLLLQQRQPLPTLRGSQGIGICHASVAAASRYLGIRHALGRSCGSSPLFRASTICRDNGVS